MSPSVCPTCKKIYLFVFSLVFLWYKHARLQSQYSVTFPDVPKGLRLTGDEPAHVTPRLFHLTADSYYTFLSVMTIKPVTVLQHVWLCNSLPLSTWNWVSLHFPPPLATSLLWHGQDVKHLSENWICTENWLGYTNCQVRRCVHFWLSFTVFRRKAANIQHLRCKELADIFFSWLTNTINRLLFCFSLNYEA